MSNPANGPMTFDELSELYRMEMKSSSVTEARKDLFRALASLLMTLRQEYERQAAIDVESIICEGAEARKKNAERMAKEVIRIRTQKICSMALRSATGSKNTLDVLTPEEKDYYDSVLDLTKKHICEVDALRGRKKTVDTRIDEPIEPRKPVEAEEPAEPVPELPAKEEPPVFDDGFDEPFDDQPIPEELEAMMEEEFGEPSPEPVPEKEPEPAPEPVPESEPVYASVPSEDRSELSPVLIRILEDLPTFAGPERDYSLCKEDIITMPKVLAEPLVSTGKACNVRPTP